MAFEELKRSEFSHIRLLNELGSKPDDWRNYLRMHVATYVYLLNLVTPYIQKRDTCMRKTISPHKRLRFLTTGRSYKDMEFTTIMSKQALSEIIPKTCEAIYKVMNVRHVAIKKSKLLT